MASFDFITDQAFRASLESDYSELQQCMEHECWKAVLVLSGSIVEALLVDYLIASNYQQRTAKDPLRMKFEDIISACKEEGALSPTTASLSDVIRNYRNLIHPGRVIRLGETPDANSAKIAATLVDMIAEEISEKRQASLGRTAEQIVDKLERDPSAAGILSHLLKDAAPTELRRLLLDVLPEAYYRYSGVYPSHPADPFEEETFVPDKSMLALFRTCFRKAFEMVDDQTKKCVTKHFVTIIKEASAPIVLTYETAFFRATDLQYLSDDDRKLVMTHLLSRLRDEVSLPLLEAVAGIGAYLGPDDLRPFMRPLAQEFVADKNHELAEAARKRLAAEYARMKKDIQQRYERTLLSWEKSAPTQRLAARMQKLIEDVTIPF